MTRFLNLSALDSRLVTTKRTTTGGGQMLKANVIVLNINKYNRFLCRGGGFAEFFREGHLI